MADFYDDEMTQERYILTNRMRLLGGGSKDNTNKELMASIVNKLKNEILSSDALIINMILEDFERS